MTMSASCSPDHPLAPHLEVIALLAGLDLPSVDQARLAVAVRVVCEDIEARVGAEADPRVRALLQALRRLARRFEAEAIEPPAFWRAFARATTRLDRELAGRPAQAAA